jgi:predicted MFS family arabinose efflux permease
LFAALTGVEIIRSTVSFGVNTFVSLYWIRELNASSALGSTALTLELAGGVLGTVVGGRIGDHIGLVRTVQLGNVLLIPALCGLLICDNRFAALPLVTLVGLVTNIPFAVLIKLGQDYLPTRPATAAGVTLGLAVSAGGRYYDAHLYVANWGTHRVMFRLPCDLLAAWSRVEAMIATRKPAEYDAAVTLLTDLQALAEREDRYDTFTLRTIALLHRRGRKPALIERLNRAGI